MRRFARLLILAGSAALLASACGEDEQAISPAELPPVAAATPEEEAAPPAPSEPFTVTGVEIGNALGPDKRVVEAGGVFAPTDTIYASVVSEGAAPTVTLSARWTAEDGAVVHEEEQTLSPVGDAVSEFHLAKPEGFAPGKYRVD